MRLGERMISVGVVNADQMLLDGVGAWLRLADGIRMTASSRTIDGFLRDLAIPLDVIVLSLLLADGSDPLENLRRLLLVGRVLTIGDAACGKLGEQTLRAGASAYLSSEYGLGVLVDTIRGVARSGDEQVLPEQKQRPNLAPQERAVLVAYASGLTLAAAARQIGVQPVTAKNYLARVKEKYRQVGRPTFTKLDLAARVREDGL